MQLEIFQNQPVIRLQSGNAQALVSAAHGAHLINWQRGDWTILSWPDNADWDRASHVRGGDPVLFPFIARTFHQGKIGFWSDAAGVVRPAPMHGFAKESPFTIVDAGADFVRLRLDANDATLGFYPFKFRLEVTYRLSDNFLETTYHIANRGEGSMPWSAGHHYYFHVPAGERGDWELTLPCSRWGTQDFSDGSIHFHPTEFSQAPLSEKTWIDRFQLEPDWNNLRLTHAKSGRSIVFQNPSGVPSDWPCVTTWTEKPDSNFFCIEPWSALPNAVHNGIGLRHLTSGETAEIVCRICLEPS